MRVEAYVRWTAILVPCALAFNRFWLRPWVLSELGHPWAVVFVGSFPNFLEALLGTLVLSLMATAWRDSKPRPPGFLADPILYLFTTAAAAVYVVSQELNVHRLGGNNVYDPYDVAASVVGLLVSYCLISKFGLVESPAGQSPRR